MINQNLSQTSNLTLKEGMKKSIILSDILLGSSLIITCKLITNNDYFIFGMFTFFIIPALFLIYFLIAGILEWWLTLLGFLVCFGLTNLLLEEIISAFPNTRITNEESFPLSNYYIIDSILIVLSKIIFDVFIIRFLQKKLIKDSIAQKVFRKFKLLA
jgi:hypothetical protein